MHMKVIYYITYCLGYLISLFPLRILYVFSDLLYFPLYYLIGYRKKIVRKNLTESFPEKDKSALRVIERQFYRWLCDYLVETLKLFSISKKSMMKRMTFSDIHEIAERMETEHKNFCFIYLGHYCNWEWIASLGYWAPKWMHCAQIYHPLYNKMFDRLFLKLRSQFGGECIPMKETLRRVIELKRDKQRSIVGFISDQAPKWNSIHHWIDFLHHRTPIFIGTEKIGKKIDALIYYADVKRVKRGYYHCEFRFIADDITAIPDFELTDRYTKLLEESIRRAPAFWLWSHNRWKRTYEEWIHRQKT